MGYRFAPGVFACRADGQLVVLNLRADRYLLLPPAIDASLTRLLLGENDEPEDPALRARLCEQALVLEACPSGGLALCDHPCPERSLVDSGWPTPGPLALAGAAIRVTRAGFALRYCGLERAIGRVADTTATAGDDLSRVDRAAAAFAALRLALPSFDRCLPLSVALAAAAKRHHAGVRLVLGVKCNPFGAHAWVQLGTRVLNDRLDAVRNFTPILAL